MHQTIEAFNAAQKAMLKLTTQVVCMAYQLGDPATRNHMEVFEAIEYECDTTFETILVEVRYGIGQTLGRGRTHFSICPVYAEPAGFHALQKRVTALFAATGRELHSLESVHITESDCWGLLVRLRI